ncbi:MAG: hypothetical protein JNN07_03310 [Verrucomicrobiales bacterium]|nr:hypothetical protein [Verrucomicrobiales bacterium]
MKRSLIWLAACLWLVLPARAAGPDDPVRPSRLELSSPLDYQVIQRASKSKGIIPIVGRLSGGWAKGQIEARLVVGGRPGKWRRVASLSPSAGFAGSLAVPSGGWYGLEIRAVNGREALDQVSVAHVGVGEVLVVAGQSNSANHGEEKQQATTGRVVTFDGKRWQLCNDPQPGASGGGGSFLPPLGDALTKRLGVPVGFISCGIGATSVREWLPKGSTFPNPPTLVSRVRQLPGGYWECDGRAFESLVARLKQAGLQGFRAVLWHQGESDANQADTTRTLAGHLYREYLEKIIRESNRQIGWEAPWFVAQVSYHVPGDEASPDIRAAQASLWKDGVAMEGPDSDALKGALRDSGGKGVHFSGPGLREHAARWADKVVPWIERK